MTDIDSLLGASRLVDLTQPLGPGTTLWPGSTPFAATVVASYEADGYYARELAVPEHAGTHLDAPCHFDPDGARIHEIPLAALVRPLVKLDVRHVVGDDASVVIGATTVLELEARDGDIPAGSAVLVHTGWDAYHLDAARYLGGGEVAFPGLGSDAAELLVDRGVAGIGIDTLSVDPGSAADHPAHHLVLPAGIWQLEGLVGLAEVPARGAWLVAAPPLLVDGSGATTRAFAIVPDA